VRRCCWPAAPAFAAEAETTSADGAEVDGEAAGAAVAAASAASYDGAEIIVSARRRDESAQDVPIALSVVGASQLEATGNYSLTQIQQIVRACKCSASTRATPISTSAGSAAMSR
jgi:iron complex outermembrane receptor protein